MAQITLGTVTPRSGGRPVTVKWDDGNGNVYVGPWKGDRRAKDPTDAMHVAEAVAASK